MYSALTSYAYSHGTAQFSWSLHPGEEAIVTDDYNHSNPNKRRKRKKEVSYEDVNMQDRFNYDRAEVGLV